MENNAEIVLRKAKSQGIVISRIPINTRNIFTELAEQEFADDYGLCFKAILDDFLEYQKLKYIFIDNIDMKLDIIIDKLNNVKEETPEKFRKSLSGEKIEGRKLK